VNGVNSEQIHCLTNTWTNGDELGVSLGGSKIGIKSKVTDWKCEFR
jgi:hypothetical protein